MQNKMNNIYCIQNVLEICKILFKLLDEWNQITGTKLNNNNSTQHGIYCNYALHCNNPFSVVFEIYMRMVLGIININSLFTLLES